MSRDSIAAAISAQIWQTIGMRGGLPSLPQQELATLVEAIAAGVAAGLETVETQYPAPPPQPPAPTAPVSNEERLVWQGKPHPTAGKDALSVQYEITSQRIKVRRGMLGRSADEAELIRVQDVRVNQGLTDRGLGIGDVTIITSDANQPEIVLRKVSNPNDIKELIRTAVREEQQRRGVRYRDVM